MAQHVNAFRLHLGRARRASYDIRNDFRRERFAVALTQYTPISKMPTRPQRPGQSYVMGTYRNRPLFGMVTCPFHCDRWIHS